LGAGEDIKALESFLNDKSSNSDPSRGSLSGKHSQLKSKQLQLPFSTSDLMKKRLSKR
jgi:hypothetical protein